VTLTSERVLRRYYAVSLVYALAGGFLAGVYPVFLRSRGLNQLEINSVLAAYFVVTFLTDVPTGAFADALGRRVSFVLGCALRAVAFALYFVSQTYALFLIAEAIDAAGTSCAAVSARSCASAWARPRASISRASRRRSRRASGRGCGGASRREPPGTARSCSPGSCSRPASRWPAPARSRRHRLSRSRRSS
jgi:MFS family permease